MSILQSCIPFEHRDDMERQDKIYSEEKNSLNTTTILKTWTGCNFQQQLFYIEIRIFIGITLEIIISALFFFFYITKL